MNVRKFKYNRKKIKNELNNDNFLGTKVKSIFVKNLNASRGHTYSPNSVQN